MSRSRRVIIGVVLTLALAAPVPGPAQDVKYWREDTAVTPAPELSRFNTLLADLAEKLKPALVHVRVRRGGGGRDSDDTSPVEPRRSTGSGFLIDPNGLIVTNAHVVEDSDAVQVTLSDGRSFGGKHHSTVIHSIKKVEELRRSNAELNTLVANFLESFK